MLTTKVDWTSRLTLFQRLILISILQQEKLVLASTEYVCEAIGRKFTEIPKNNTLSALCVFIYFTCNSKNQIA